MGEFSKADERRYWQQMRSAYIEMGERMMAEPGWHWCDPSAFYRAIFPEGFLQEAWSEDSKVKFDGKPNGIALKFGPKKKKAVWINGKKSEELVIERYTVTDDLDGIEQLVRASIAENVPVYMAPVSWFGKANKADNARFLHAFAVDLDGVTPGKLGTVLKQMRNGHDPSLPKYVSMPQASFIVMSGRGLHLYYLLDRPVPMKKSFVPFLQELKRRLTDVVWTDYTSELGNEGRQYQGIYQGFRMPGTTTRLNGHGIDDKEGRKYEAVAFAYEQDGEPVRCSLDYLIDYCGIRGDGISDDLRRIMSETGRTPLAEAAEKWPEWYRRRVIEKRPVKGFDYNRAAYDSWYRRIYSEAVVHGRYFAVLGLVAYARKCGVPYDELERDAYALVPRLDSISDEPGNRFTDYDVACALAAFDDDRIKRWKNVYMCRRAKIEAHENKRNGRTQDQHLKLARFARDLNYSEEGGWREGNGRKPKRDEIRRYAAMHSEANHSEIARALGVSRPTVAKWLKPGWEDEWNSRPLPAGAYLGDDGRIHATIVDWEERIPEFAELAGKTAAKMGGGFFLEDENEGGSDADDDD